MIVGKWEHGFVSWDAGEFTLTREDPGRAARAAEIAFERRTRVPADVAVSEHDEKAGIIRETIKRAKPGTARHARAVIGTLPKGEIIHDDGE